MRNLVLTVVALAAIAAAQTKPSRTPSAATPAHAKQSAAAQPRVATAAENAAQTTAARLPVRRVVLYKNGVGYFEHSGRVRGNQDISIDFTSGQLNDVLKSLTVLDLGGGKIGGVSYNSTAPLEQRLKGLRLPLGEDVTLAQFLTAVRGSRVEVRGGGATVVGRLLGVEERERTGKDDHVVKYEVVSLMTDGGELRNFELTPALSVRLVERDLNEEASRYLNLLAQTREQDVRRMQISTTGTGERQLVASYISEVPVWKSTYRLVLPTKTGAKPLLQGWAIVDNTVGEDWNNVELALVAGAPQSFVENLSQPFYARRPIVQVQQSAMLTPQTHEGTMLDKTEASNAEFGRMQQYYALQKPGAAPPPPPAAAPTRAKSSKGVAGGVPGGVIGGIVGSNIATSPAAVGGGVGGGTFSVGDELAKQTIESQSRNLGDLFEYKLKQPVTIRKNQSALVPILQANVDAEQVTLWNEASGVPLRAVWLNNTSGMTLDGGAFNIIDQDTFAGEGVMDPVKAGEKRLLSYALDLGVRVESKLDYSSEQRMKLRIVRGVLVGNSERVEHRTYHVRNENDTPRTVIIEHAARPNFKFVGNTPKPDESSQRFHRFRVTVQPKQTADLKLDESMPIAVRYELTNLTPDNIDVLVKQRAVSPEVEKALAEIMRRKRAIAELDAQASSVSQKIEAINTDQERVRENMKALKGSAEEKQLIQRYTRELNDQEDRMATLRSTQENLSKQRDAAQQELNKSIENMTVEAGD